LENIYRNKLSKSRAYLKESDVDLLNFVAIHGFVTQKQLIYYASNLYGLTENGMRSKLRRWSEKDILSSQIYGPRNSMKLYFSLGAKGHEILVEMGVKVDKATRKENKLPRYRDHYIAIRDLISKVLVEYKLANKTITSRSPYSSAYQTDRIQDIEFTLPDWILETEDEILLLELDSGSEGLSKAKAKIDGFANVAHFNRGHSYHVLWAVIDNADDFFEYTSDYFGINRSIRVRNLEKLVIESNAHLLPNLKFSICQISKAHVVTKNWITQFNDAEK